MKSLIAIGTIICACTLITEEGHADVRCYSNPYNNYSTCEDRGHVKPWIDNSRQQNSRYRNNDIGNNSQPFPIDPRQQRVPIHNYSECTIATGCLPGRR